MRLDEKIERIYCFPQFGSKDKTKRRKKKWARQKYFLLYNEKKNHTRMEKSVVEERGSK